MPSPTRHDTAHDSGEMASFGLADCLSLAAAPAFAAMALATALLGDSAPPHAFCLAMQDPSPVGGMAPMYLLMGAVHSAPWLRLIGRHRT